MEDLYKPPAFQFYPDDFVAETADLTTEEIGAYVLLMCREWKKGSVPNDVPQMARIARLPIIKMRRAWAQLAARFELRNDEDLIQPRLERVREDARLYADKMSKKGRKGADSRWHRHGAGNAHAEPGDCEDDAQIVPADGSPVSSLPLVPKGTGETPGTVPPKRRKQPSESDLAAYRILAAAWPVISRRHGDIGMTQKTWRQRNKASAVDMVELGRTPEQVVEMLEIAFESKFHNGVRTLAKLQEYWPRLKAVADEPEDPAELQKRIMRGDFLPYR